MEEAVFLSPTWAIVFAVLLFMIGLSAGTQKEKVIQASEVETKIRAGEPAEFDEYTIKGDLNLNELKIERPVHFNHTIFQDSVTFKSIVFNSTAYFASSVFKGDVDFGDSTFKGDAYFDRSNFNGKAYFMFSTFNDYAYFQFPIFNDYALFKDSTFNSDVYFRYSTFKGDADFWFSKFNGDADFWDTEFNSDAYFRYSTFNGDVDFGGSTFGGRTYFRDARFNSDADFEDNTFGKEAEFSEVVFKRNASFNNSLFNGNAFFKNTAFENELSLTDTTYNKLIIRWHKIAKFVYDETAYMSLLKNFKNLGYYEDYDSCYFDYRKAHRSQEDWPSVPPWEEAFRKAIDYPLQQLYGYGTKPLNAFFWSLGIVLIFALYWWWVGLGSSSDKTKESLKDSEEWPNSDATDILGFSVTVFLSGTKFFIDPPVLPRIDGRSRSWIKKAFVLERVLGALFSVLFFIAISGTIVRAA